MCLRNCREKLAHRWHTQRQKYKAEMILQIPFVSVEYLLNLNNMRQVNNHFIKEMYVIGIIRHYFASYLHLNLNAFCASELLNLSI